MNLKDELKKSGQSWNASGEYDGTEYEGRYFLSDTELDDFAKKADCFCSFDILCEGEAINQNKFEKFFNCRVIFDYEGANPLRQWGDSEIIFNDEKELYIVASGIEGIHDTPEKTASSYIDYISEYEKGSISIDEYLEYDGDRLTYEHLKEIADKNPNWFDCGDYKDYFVSGSVMLTADQAEELKKTFFIYPVSELVEEVRSEYDTV